MELLHIKEKQVQDVLEKLKISKSPGPDGLHPAFLKELSPELCKPLTLIFNTSLKLGTLPTEWKNCQITAILKKGNQSCAGNYRPFSLTSVVAKCMENNKGTHNTMFYKQ